MANTQKIDSILNTLFNLEPLPAGVNPNERKRFNDGQMSLKAKTRIIEQHTPYIVYLEPRLKTKEHYNTEP